MKKNLIFTLVIGLMLASCQREVNPIARMGDLDNVGIVDESHNDSIPIKPVRKENDIHVLHNEGTVKEYY